MPSLLEVIMSETNGDSATTGIERAITQAGGQDSLAERMGCTQQNVSVWKKNGYVPLVRAVEIEQLTGVPREDLISPRIKEVIGQERF
jgi:DNA-binding transcriptional regulator YdaS (Cro superfamily)